MRSYEAEGKLETCDRMRSIGEQICNYADVEGDGYNGDVVELQLAHLDNSTVEGLYKKHGPLALIGSRTKLMQHWADRIDHWLDPKKVMPIKRGTQA
jgi:hypothetical protein